MAKLSALLLVHVVHVEAAVEDLACSRDGSFLEVIQYLEQAAGYRRNSDGCLLGGLEHVLFSHILGRIIPID